MNLARLRDCSPTEIDFQGRHSSSIVRSALGTVEERADRVLAVAVRNVELHGWTPAITDDHCACG